MINLNKKEDFKFVIKEFHGEALPETMERELKIPLNGKKPITVFGPRRSGKSFYFYTLIKQLINNGVAKERILYLNFEDDRILPLNFKDLGALLEAYFELYPENKNEKIFLFFDELQRVDNWEVFIRRVYDKEKAAIFITGSSSKLLSREIASSLRGRALSFPLYPLNFREFLKFKGEEPQKNFEYTAQKFKIKKLLNEYLEYGGFPEVALEKNKELKKKILREYFNSLVYHDLAERYSLEKTDALKELLKRLFTDITSLFSVNSYYKNIRQISPVARETIYDYLSYIQETDYFVLLPRFSYSLKAQKVSPGKIISLDNGLRNTISFRFSQDTGKLAENLAGNVLYADTAWKKEIYYWKNKREVDFIVKEAGELTAVNVCFGKTIEKRETESLLEFKNKFKKTKKLILITQDLEQKAKGIEFIPLWKWLLT